MPKDFIDPNRPETPAPDEFAENFQLGLLQWNREENHRKMPWKGEKDPYRIWLSEIILQQTRVEQGLKYYENFIKTFPDIKALATAPDAQVFKLWEGLGYYSRCRNLLHTARQIASEMDGVFPKDHASILALKGIGHYTAAAIASFAYNLPHAVLDGNVYRILSRIYNIDTPVDSTPGRKEFAGIAQNLLPAAYAAEYNQAIMDFGATVCKPSPDCSRCFFQHRCRAYRAGRQDLLPVKEKKISRKERWFNYFILQHNSQVLIRKRQSKDIWQDLYEFLLVETGHDTASDELLQLFEKQYGATSYTLQSESTSLQQLSHQTVHFRFLQLRMGEAIQPDGYEWMDVESVSGLAFPKTLQQMVVNYQERGI